MDDVPIKFLMVAVQLVRTHSMKIRMKHLPTSETLLAYVKGMARKEIFDNAKGQVEYCIKELKKKGLSLKNVVIAFD
jgi:hypothetical protein